MKIKESKGNVNLAYIEIPEVTSTENYKVIQNKDLDSLSAYSVLKKEAVDGVISISSDDIPMIDKFIFMTNVIKDGAPFFYKHKLKNKIKKFIDFETQFFIYDSVLSKRVDESNYKLIPISEPNDLFSVYVFFNESLTDYDRFYLYYKNSDGSETQETLSPEFAYYPARSLRYNFEYTANKDYNASTINVKIPEFLLPNTTFYIDFVNFHKITIEKIDGLSRDEKWGIRIRNGFFEKKVTYKNELKFVYNLKEFNEQVFDSDGIPYKRIKETPNYLDNMIILKNPLLHLRQPINIYINGKIVFTEATVKSIDRINGIITLPRIISPNETLYVEYTAIIDYIDYLGYYDFNYGERIDFNMNPTVGNKINFLTNTGEKRTHSVFQKMKKPIYIYLKPLYTYHCNEVISNQDINYLQSAEIYDVDEGVRYTVITLPKPALTSGIATIRKKLGGTDDTVTRAPNSYLNKDEVYWAYDNENKKTNTKIRIYNTDLLYGQPLTITYTISDKMKLSKTNKESSIFHSDVKLSDDLCSLNGYILLGEVYCYPNSTIDDIKYYDARVRGGGITDKLKDEVRRLIEPESDHYWDIGFWDGENFQQKAICFRFGKNVLQENGGNVTIDDIKKSIENHIEEGTKYVIEFVDIEEHILLK